MIEEEGQSDSETIEKTPISIDIPNSPTESGSSASSESSMSLRYRMLDFGHDTEESETVATATTNNLTQLGDDHLKGGVKPSQYALRPRGNDKKVIPKAGRYTERFNFLYAKIPPT